jgi:hypothetical protein
MKRLLILCTLLLSTSACTIPIQPALERPPLVEPLEVTIGKCFRPAIAKYEYLGEGKEALFNFPLGPPSVEMFDIVFTGMFVKTVPVEHCRPETSRGPDVDAVIETQIEIFRGNMATISQRDGEHRAEVEITYRFLLFSPEGETIHSWTVAGSGLFIPDNTIDPFLPQTTWYSKAVKLAMRDAASKFVRGFRNQPKIQKWLQGLDVSSRTRQ